MERVTLDEIERVGNCESHRPCRPKESQGCILQPQRSLCPGLVTGIVAMTKENLVPALVEVQLTLADACRS